MFSGAAENFSREDLMYTFIENSIDESHWDSLMDTLLWYGVLGFDKNDGTAEYIYDTVYDLKLLKARNQLSDEKAKIFQVNPAFWPSLGIGENRNQYQLV